MNGFCRAVHGSDSDPEADMSKRDFNVACQSNCRRLI